MDRTEYQRVRELFHELAERPLEEQQRELETRDLSAEARTQLEALLGHEDRLSAFGEEQLGQACAHWLATGEL